MFAFVNDHLGRTSLVKHVIDTGDATPIRQKPYQTTLEDREEIDRQVDDMLHKGIIHESLSP